jgi:hypothetical protein
VRREIAKECIYGVDVNGMAVELGKLSMWLETLAADRPLAFLDHHLKQGNSLVGSDVTAVLSNGAESDDGQLTLQQSFARLRERTLDHVMDLMRELLEVDNETLDDIKSMEELYDEIRSDALYQRLFELANVHTAEEFGVDVPENAYETMARAIENPDDWAELRDEPWFREAQRKARAESFFHWELEFPGVFFDADGEKREDAGFDAVIGNPPYVKIQNIGQRYKNYFSNKFVTAKERYDLYSLFVENSFDITKRRFGMILPNKFFESRAGKPLRNHLESSESVKKIVDFKRNQVFHGATVYTCLLFLNKQSKPAQIEYGEISSDPELEMTKLSFTNVDITKEGNKWNLVGETEQELLSKIEEGKSLEALTEQILVGVQTSANDVYVLRDCVISGNTIEGYSPESDERIEIEKGVTRPFVTDNNVSRYKSPDTDARLIYPYNKKGDIYSETELEREYPEAYSYLADHKHRLEDRGSETQEFETWYAHWCPRDPAKFERQKILISQVAKKGESTYDYEGGIYFSSTVYTPILKQDSELLEMSTLGVLNSNLIYYYIMTTGTVLRGGYYRYKTEYIQSIGIPTQELDTRLEGNVNKIIDLKNKRSTLNLSLLDYLGISTDDDLDGDRLGDLYMPPAGLADSTVAKTAEELEGLRVEGVDFEEDGTRLVMSVDISYKPDEDDPRETDTYGRLAESEFETYEAMVFTGLSDAEETLVRNFVPVAVDEAGGFAGFRQSATQTIRLIDRLEDLTLPDVDATRDGLERYIDVKERADELDEKIQKTDDLIDEIVYDLYGLTDEEIEIVEEAVGD